VTQTILLFLAMVYDQSLRMPMVCVSMQCSGSYNRDVTSVHDIVGHRTG